jgi:hypothetical protein
MFFPVFIGSMALRPPHTRIENMRLRRAARKAGFAQSQGIGDAVQFGEFLLAEQFRHIRVKCFDGMDVGAEVVVQIDGRTRHGFGRTATRHEQHLLCLQQGLQQGSHAIPGNLHPDAQKHERNDPQQAMCRLG